MDGITWPSVLTSIASPEPISGEMAAWAMREVFRNQATEAQTSAFIFGLKTRGETPEQVSALATVMLEFANLVPELPHKRVILDIVGTGGDGSHSVNISTMAAVVAATCGVTVIKHGNRAFSSSTGSADLLEALGLEIDLTAEQVGQVADLVNIGFCFAPKHHPATRFAAPVRVQLAVPTVFNIMGPLTNPGRANAGLIGCANVLQAPTMARVLADRGVKAIVVRGTDGLDEISLSAPTQIWDATTGAVKQSLIEPGDFGVSNFNPAHLRGGEPSRNAELTKKVFGGLDLGTDIEVVESIRIAVALNAAAGMAAAECVVDPDASATSLVQRINSHFSQAQQVLDSGETWRVFNQWVIAAREVKAAG